jgi:hypothetical protein
MAEVSRRFAAPGSRRDGFPSECSTASQSVSDPKASAFRAPPAEAFVRSQNFGMEVVVGVAAGIAVFGRINRVRQRRHDSEYPSEDTPAISTEDAERALAIAREAVDAARKLIASGKLDPFE